MARERGGAALAPLPALRQLAAAAAARAARRGAIPPRRDEVEVPLRGKALRDKIVLRADRDQPRAPLPRARGHRGGDLRVRRQPGSLHDPVFKSLTDLQGGVGGPTTTAEHGLIHEVRHLFSVQSGTLTKIGLVVSAYALVEGVEAVGLWL